MGTRHMVSQRLDSQTVELLEAVQSLYTQRFPDLANKKFALVTCIRSHHKELFPHLWDGDQYLPEKKEKKFRTA